MNDIIKAIVNRRSVRTYSPGQIKDDELELILQAGLFAPSAHNEQSWHFTVVQDKEVMNKLNSATKQEMRKQESEKLRQYGQDENFDIFYDAPTIVVVSGKKTAIVPNIDCAAATQNMLIAAESLNIGSCWIGLLAHLFRSDEKGEYSRMLGVTEGFEPYYAITLGYKAIEDKPAPPRRENTVNYIKAK